MAKLILERSLEAEMDDHLGYEKWEQTVEQIDKNFRKRHTPKTLKSTIWGIIYSFSKRSECRIWTANS